MIIENPGKAELSAIDLEDLKAKASRIIAAASGIEALCMTWICCADRCDVLLVSSQELGSEREQEVLVVLRSGGVEVATCTYTLEALEESFDQILPLSDFVSVIADDDSFGGVSLEVDDAGLNKYLEFDPDSLYAEELVGPLLTPAQALRVALMYAISPRGEVKIALLDGEEVYADNGTDPDWWGEQIAVMYLCYSEAIPRQRIVQGINEVMYIHLAPMPHEADGRQEKS